MARFVINGGRPVGGAYRPAGNKNAALPMLAASLLTDEPVRLQNVPLIDDVRTMLALLEDLGATVEVRGHSVTVHAARIRKRTLHPELCRRVRSSVLFAGPMAARHGKVILSPPGGDIIGRRRIDTHIAGLAELGIRMHGQNHYRFERERLGGAKILLDEASVTATENILMAAVLAEGRTTIFNAACEPHVQDLCRMLNRMGARIENIGTNYLKIDGVDSLHGVTARVPPDYIEAVSFLAAAAVTGGALTVTEVPSAVMDVVSRPFRKLGVEWRTDGSSVSLPARRRRKVQDDFGGAIPRIDDGVWPSFPSDLMSVAIVTATQAQGQALFFEKMFESRMVFVDRLIEMGARIVRCDPHRVMVAGPSRLHGTHLSSPDIRAGMAMLIAALAARGTSIIDNAQSIDRGYEQIERRLGALGADIERTEG